MVELIELYTINKIQESFFLLNNRLFINSVDSVGFKPLFLISFLFKAFPIFQVLGFL